MAKRTKSIAGSKEHEFGGDWTEQKLTILRKYLAAYIQVLKATSFRKGFIDAFAGTGYRSASAAVIDETQSLFPEFETLERRQLLDGSARLALGIQPSFDRYVFIERNTGRCLALESLKTEFPDHAKQILVLQGDANEQIRELCARNWEKHRAVMFVDPYGMQVDWETIVAIAKTQAIDLWLLFPLGVGVNRLVTRSGEIPEGWRRRLNALLGTEDWFEEFYTVESTPNLFGETDTRVVKASVDVIGGYFVKRLRSIFADVATPAVLRNSTNSPLYLFCFAAGNPKGAKTAVKIANDLTKGMH